jgi:hypothetical protein
MICLVMSKVGALPWCHSVDVSLFGLRRNRFFQIPLAHCLTMDGVCSLMGVSLNIPVKSGRLALGTWQGIYLNEHRDQGGWGGGHQRSVIITLQGQGK